MIITLNLSYSLIGIRIIRGWVKTYYYHIWKNQHPLTSYFRYHPGARVLTHKHVEDLPQPTLAGFEAGSFGAFIDPLGPMTFTTLATANHANGLVVHHWPGAPDH